jgi:hypothetical protein
MVDPNRGLDPDCMHMSRGVLLVVMLSAAALLSVPASVAAADGPTILSPGPDAPVTGLVQVEVASTGPYVRVSFVGGDARVANVVEGVATVGVPSWGLSGSEQLVAQDCPSSSRRSVVPPRLA